MLAAAVADDERLLVDDRELHRDGPSYTLDTLREFRAAVGERPLVFLVGADSYAQLDQWRDWQHYPELCHLAVAPRPGAGEPPPAVTAAFTVTHEPETLMTRPAGHALLLNGPELDVSATALRAALKAGEAVEGLPPGVADYIHRHGLYRRSSPG
jgi:nicotinate-nucleotide adenylyltransferase